MLATLTGFNSTQLLGKSSQKPRYPHLIPQIFLTLQSFQRETTRDLMTTFKPGHNPPHVTIPARTSSPAKQTCFRTPALRNFRDDSSSRVSVQNFSQRTKVPSLTKLDSYQEILLYVMMLTGRYIFSPAIIDPQRPSSESGFGLSFTLGKKSVIFATLQTRTLVCSINSSARLNKSISCKVNLTLI